MRHAAGAPALVVLAKFPAPGRVKTRLCPPCTPDQAALLAEAALKDTLDAARGTRASRIVVAWDGDPAWPALRGLDVVDQRSGGLDERLAGAIADVGGPALLIGMDTPHVSARPLDRALLLLMEPGVDAVLGLAQDGGWWALGLRRPDPEVFLGIPTSTDTTGAEQARRLDSLGLRWEAMPTLRDVDRFDDAVAVGRLVPGSRFGRAVAAVEASLLLSSRAEQ